VASLEEATTFASPQFNVSFGNLYVVREEPDGVVTWYVSGPVVGHHALVATNVDDAIAEGAAYFYSLPQVQEAGQPNRVTVIISDWVRDCSLWEAKCVTTAAIYPMI
jgi:hypothetical protein